VVLLAVGALAGAPAAGASGHPDVPRLDWKPCDDGFECATAAVPLDHDRPHGRTIELALIRFPAIDREHRIGSLFIHPGGSGGQGVDFVRTAPPPALELIARRFDLVGVDTRGVGASRPASTATPIPSSSASTPSRSRGRRRSTRRRCWRARGRTWSAARRATPTCWRT
jgi:pimeloyl-ACP methyl ester carboxylesterase